MPFIYIGIHIFTLSVSFSIQQEDVLCNKMIKERERRETETRILKEARSVDVAKDLPPHYSRKVYLNLIC